MEIASFVQLSPTYRILLWHGALLFIFISMIIAAHVTPCGRACPHPREKPRRPQEVHRFLLGPRKSRNRQRSQRGTDNSCETLPKALAKPGGTLGWLRLQSPRLGGYRHNDVMATHEDAAGGSHPPTSHQLVDVPQQEDAQSYSYTEHDYTRSAKSPLRRKPFLPHPPLQARLGRAPLISLAYEKYKRAVSHFQGL